MKKNIFKNFKTYSDTGILQTHKYMAVIDGLFNFNYKATDSELISAIDLNNNLITPGFIDIHTHGALKRDSLEDDTAAHRTIARYHASTGTTAYCPTFLAASLNDMKKACSTIAKIKDNRFPNEARIIGVHIEGTFCSRNKKGAQDDKYFLEYNDELKDFLFDKKNNIVRITLAPDVENSQLIAKELTEHGIQVSLGHDDSYEEEIDKCINAGANSTTHLYNCTSSIKRINGKKVLGLLELSLLYNNHYVEIIADSYHVPNKLLPIIFKTKNANNVILVSDSISIAGVDDNTSAFLDVIHKDRELIVKNGVGVEINTGICSGSITPISKMLVNLKQANNKYHFIKDNELLNTTAKSSAHLLGIENLASFKDACFADFNVLDDNFNVISTYISGEQI